MSRPRMTPERANDMARKNFQKSVQHKRLDMDMAQWELAMQLDLGPSGLSAQLANPDKIPVGRLRRIIQILHLDPMVILALVGYTDKEIKQLRERLAA